MYSIVVDNVMHHVGFLLMLPHCNMSFAYGINTLFSFQAHLLFNSIAARKSTGAADKWKRKAFELQKLYWGDNSSVDYETQGTLTNHLKSELEHIRDKYRVEIKHVDELVNQFDSNYIGSEHHKTLNKAMEGISVACSEDMRMFARKVIGKSVSLLKQSAPCFLRLLQ